MIFTIDGGYGSSSFDVRCRLPERKGNQPAYLPNPGPNELLTGYRLKHGESSSFDIAGAPWRLHRQLKRDPASSNRMDIARISLRTGVAIALDSLIQTRNVLPEQKGTT